LIAIMLRLIGQLWSKRANIARQRVWHVTKAVHLALQKVLPVSDLLLVKEPIVLHILGVRGLLHRSPLP